MTQRDPHTTSSTMSRRGLLGALAVGTSYACVKGSATAEPCAEPEAPDSAAETCAASCFTAVMGAQRTTKDVLSSVDILAEVRGYKKNGSRGDLHRELDQELLRALSWPLPTKESEPGYVKEYDAAFEKAFADASAVTFFYSDVNPFSETSPVPFKPALYCAPGTAADFTALLDGLDPATVSAALEAVESEQEGAVESGVRERLEAALPIFQTGSFDVVVSKSEALTACTTVSFYNGASYGIMPVVSTKNTLQMSEIASRNYNELPVVQDGEFSVRICVIIIPDPTYKISVDENGSSSCPSEAGTIDLTGGETGTPTLNNNGWYDGEYCCATREKSPPTITCNQ